MALTSHFRVDVNMAKLISPSLFQIYVQKLFDSCCVPYEINKLKNYTIYHTYLIPQEYNEMVHFTLRKFKCLEKKFGTYQDSFKN